MNLAWGHDGIFFQRFAANGAAKGRRLPLQDGPSDEARGADIVRTSAGFVVGWDRPDQIVFAHLDGSGNLVSAPSPVGAQFAPLTRLLGIATAEDDVLALSADSETDVTAPQTLVFTVLSPTGAVRVPPRVIYQFRTLGRGQIARTPTGAVILIEARSDPQRSSDDFRMDIMSIGIDCVR